MVVALSAAGSGCLFGATNATDAGVTEPDSPEPEPGVGPAQPEPAPGEPAVGPGEPEPGPNEPGGQPEEPEPAPEPTPEPEPGVIELDGLAITATEDPLLRGDSVQFHVDLAVDDIRSVVSVVPSDGWVLESVALNDEATNVEINLQLADDLVVLPEEFTGLVDAAVRFEVDGTRYLTTARGLSAQRADGPHVDPLAVPTGQTCGHPLLPCPTIAAAIAAMQSGIVPAQVYEREIRIADGDGQSTLEVTEDLFFGDLGLSSGWTSADQPRDNWVQIVTPTIQTPVDLGPFIASFGPDPLPTRRIEAISFVGSRSADNARPLVEVNGDLQFTFVNTQMGYSSDVVDGYFASVLVNAGGTLAVNETSIIRGPTCDACTGNPGAPTDALIGIHSFGSTSIDGATVRGGNGLTSDFSASVGLFIESGVATVQGDALLTGASADGAFGALVVGGTFTSESGVGDGPFFVGAPVDDVQVRRATGFAAWGAVVPLLEGTFNGGAGSLRAAAVHLANLEGTTTFSEAILDSEFPGTELTQHGTGLLVDAIALLPGYGAEKEMTIALQMGSIHARGVDISLGVATTDNGSPSSTVMRYENTMISTDVSPLFPTPGITSVGILSRGTGVLHSDVQLSDGVAATISADGPPGTTVIGVDTQSDFTTTAHIIARGLSTGNVTAGRVTGLVCDPAGHDVTVDLFPHPQLLPTIQARARSNDAIALDVGARCTATLTGQSDSERVIVEASSLQGTATVVRQGGTLSSTFAKLSVGNAVTAVGIESMCNAGLLTLMSTNITLDQPDGSVERFGIRSNAPNEICLAAPEITFQRGLINLANATNAAYGVTIRNRPGATVHLDQLEVFVAQGNPAVGVEIEMDNAAVLIERSIVGVELFDGTSRRENTGILLSGATRPKKVQVRNTHVSMVNRGSLANSHNAGILIDSGVTDNPDLRSNILVAHNTIVSGDTPESVGLGATSDRAALAVAQLAGTAVANFIVQKSAGIGIMEVCTGSGSQVRSARFDDTAGGPNLVSGAEANAIRSFTVSGTGCVDTSDFGETELTNSSFTTTVPVLDDMGCPVAIVSILNDLVDADEVSGLGTSNLFGNWADDYNGINATARGTSLTDIGVCEMSN